MPRHQAWLVSRVAIKKGYRYPSVMVAHQANTVIEQGQVSLHFANSRLDLCMCVFGILTWLGLNLDLCRMPWPFPARAAQFFELQYTARKGNYVTNVSDKMLANCWANIQVACWLHKMYKIPNMWPMYGFIHCAAKSTWTKHLVKNVAVMFQTCGYNIQSPGSIPQNWDQQGCHVSGKPLRRIMV